jgi:hypothetical protein
VPVGAAARLQMLAECLAPLADRLMADDDATLGEQILNVAKAEVEPKVQPDSVSDHLWRETIATGARLGQRNGWAPRQLTHRST